ncbi:hypothetical protein M404DRAFT_1001940 [Pisolithus tinctorius Marx 270]|uniref:Uncharacterized protein n=1 Tax=Pisolithus tinctorius Marx 270 TaxID=870435 RepID=A0A0C3P5E3_PISTI|nr:hypothetical protein M404DRAFT_1001940 [Pisolithus tinctorius Marx 270]
MAYPPSLSKVVGFDGKCSSASCITSHRERKQVVNPVLPAFIVGRPRSLFVAGSVMLVTLASV